MPLTIKELKQAKPGRLSDGNGLYLLTKPSGSRSWVLRVQVKGSKDSPLKVKRKGATERESDRRDYGLGGFTLESIPADIPIEKRKLLTLAEAREKARIGRLLAKAGIDPIEAWRAAEQEDAKPVTFKEMAIECHADAKRGWKNGKHRDEWLGSLQRYAFDELGDMSVDDVDAAAIQKVLLPIWLTVPETARRVKQRIGVVLDTAHVTNRRATPAPMRGLNLLMRKIKQPKAGNFPAMPHKELPAFMSKLSGAEFSVGRWALQFLILTAARAGEVRNMQWRDVELDKAQWTVPPEKSKTEKQHDVPLVPAAIEILKRMQELFGDKPDAFVFPGLKGKMSDATMNKVLRKAGGEAYSVHGFRSTFRDWVAENLSTVSDKRHPPRNANAGDVAEAALAHELPSRVEAAYRRTSFFEHRRDGLMPAWAAFALGDNSNVISLAEARA